jgi:predicted RNA-binding protein with PUA-like domain
MKYWLIKSEPESYSLDDLAKDKKTWWENVRNYQARNFMKEMQPGDMMLFYHSSADPNGVVGLAKVAQAAAPDKTQFDRKSDAFDSKATLENPIWFCVQVEFVEKFKKVVSLAEIKSEKTLAEMLVVQRGQRLSVQPVMEKHFKKILQLSGNK